MKQLIFKITFTALSVILFHGCSLEPYDWSQEKTTEIEMIEVSFPSIKNESIQVGSYIKTSGKELDKVEFILQKHNGTEWEEIEKKQGTKSDNEEEDYYVCDFNNLTGFTSYIILVNVYSSFSTEPIYSKEFNIKTALDEYSLSTGDALDITDKSVTLVTEFSSEKIKPAKEEIGIVYSENKNEVKNNKSTFIPYTNNSDYIYLTNLSELKPATTYYYCSCIIIDGQRFFSDDIRSFTLNEIEITQGELIDLGLSVKWMSYNLGADDITEYGKYYGWGDPIGTGSMEREDYPTFNNISGTGYDAAWYSLGIQYRIPTENEWNELVENCKWEWITYKNVNGYKVIGPNGNSIFLPAAGYRWMDNGGIGGCDIMGYYRIGTLEQVNDYVYSFEINENDYSKSITQPREWGISIRPVYDNTVSCETGIASEITGTSAKLTGNFKCNSDKEISECGIWYGTTEYPHKDNGIQKGSLNTDENITLNIQGLRLKTTYYYCTYVVIKNQIYYSSPKKFTTLSSVEISTEEIVDLGLSILWRGYNLGANSPEQQGSENRGNDLFGDDPLIEYICGTIYDKATQQLGKEWRLPNNNEINELIEKCTWVRTFYKGIEGYQAIGPNGKSIFFPEFDYASGNWFYRDFDDTFYMSGEIHAIDPIENAGAISGLGFETNNVSFVKSYSSLNKEALIRPVKNK